MDLKNICAKFKYIVRLASMCCHLSLITYHLWPSDICEYKYLFVQYFFRNCGAVFENDVWEDCVKLQCHF